MNAIVVINPNSDAEVTAHLDRGLEGLRFRDGPPITCLTLDDVPKGIQTAMDAAVVVGPLCRLVERYDNDAGAFVIACFGDPGIHAVREVTSKPVIGIGEAGLTAGLNLGERIGIVTNLAGDIAGHHRQNRSLGIGARVAGARCRHPRGRPARRDARPAGDDRQRPPPRRGGRRPGDRAGVRRHGPLQ